MFGLRTPPGYQDNQRPSALANDQSNYAEYSQNYQTSFNNIPQNHPRSFMSSIATIYSDYESNIAHKRKMQQELQDSLRRQIEEKKARSQMQQAPTNRNSIQQQANDMLMQMQVNPNQNMSAPINQNYNIPPQPLNDNFHTQPSRRVTFASSPQKSNVSSLSNEPRVKQQTDDVTDDKPFVYRRIPVEKFVPYKGQFFSDPPKHIEVSTESPFAHQSVSTPPLGFSVRNIKAKQQNLRNSYPNKYQAFGQTRKFYSTIKQPTFSDTFYAQKQQNQPTEIPTISQMYYPDGTSTSFPS